MGTLEAICGVIVPVLIGLSRNYSDSTNESLSNTAIVISLIGTLCLAVERFRQYGKEGHMHGE
jgi:hypothetical protein